MRFGRKTVEVIQTVLDQSLPHFRRAGQVLDGVVVIEQDAMGQLAYVVETPLGPRLFRTCSVFLYCRSASLPRGGYNGADEREEKQGRG